MSMLPPQVLALRCESQASVTFCPWPVPAFSQQSTFHAQVQSSHNGAGPEGLLAGFSSLQRYGTVCSGELLSSQMPNCCGDNRGRVAMGSAHLWAKQLD